MRKFRDFLTGTRADLLAVVSLLEQERTNTFASDIVQRECIDTLTGCILDLNERVVNYDYVKARKRPLGASGRPTESD